MPPTIIRGPVDSGARDSKMKVESKRKKIFQQLPLESSILTKILEQLPTESIPAPSHEWSYDPFKDLSGEVTDVFTDSALNSAYSSGGALNTPLYIQMTAAEAKYLKPGELIIVHNTDTMAERMLRVLQMNIGADANTYAAALLLQTDTDDALAGANLTWFTSGDAREEGSGLPDVIYREPVWLSNYTQIVMEAVEATGTELATMDEVGPGFWNRNMSQAFQRLNIKRERNFLFGRYLLTTGPKGKPMRLMRGLKNFISENVSDNVRNYKTDPGFAAKTWAAGGWDFLKLAINDASRYSMGNAKFFCGDLAHLAINDLLEEMGSYELESLDDDFGVRVKRVHGLQKTLDIVQHPLFALPGSPYRRSGLLWEPRFVRRKVLKGRDIKFVNKKDLNDEDGALWTDAKKAGWFGEETLEVDNIEAMMWFDNLGVTNTESE